MRRSCILVTIVALGAGVVASAQPLTREQALGALRNRSDVEARRQGAAWLGDTGLMADAPLLVEALRDPDELVRALAEHSLWQVWSRSGDPEVDSLFQVGIEQMNQGDPEPAIETFSLIIRKRPDFAEGWNKRATLYYLMGEYEKSLADCEEVIRRNPAHFGALSGFGMIYLQLGKAERALHYFERALAVNPNLTQVEAAVEGLKRLLRERSRESI
ncbi:MAG: tetratricopeptide repeat protein [candidate division NC10 bacterium]|nr:tetratricopeptide repeat protein [candidate division NC10 bacterium]